MKIGRVFSLPFALVADVLTLGNMGDRSYTQQIFDDERREQRNKAELEAVRIIAEAIVNAARSNDK